MSRTSENSQALNDINIEVESIVYAYALASSPEEGDDY